MSTQRIPVTDVRIGDTVIAGTAVVPNRVTVRTIETVRLDRANSYVRLNGITDIHQRATVDVVDR